MPERNHGLRTVLVGAEQQPLAQLGAKAPLLPPLANAGVLLQGGMAALGELEGACLPLSMLLGLPPAFLAHLREPNVEHAPEVEGRLYRTLDPSDGAPHVNNVTVEAAAITVNVIGVNVHRGIGVLMIRSDAMNLAVAVCFNDPRRRDLVADDLEHRCAWGTVLVHFAQILSRGSRFPSHRGRGPLRFSASYIIYRIMGTKQG
jgi:hypothetical protein